MLITASFIHASNLANPLAPIPAARVSIGASYHLGGYTITNDSVPCLMNRIHGRINYSPISYFNIGIDLGASQMDVSSIENHIPPIELFHGKYKFSYGANIKLSTPLIKDIIGLIGITQATYFSSPNKEGAVYEGFDGTGALGLLFHIPNFGYVAAGSKLYYIKGENQSYNSSTVHPYSNINNIRGWLAFDYFPKSKLTTNNLFYFSFELSISPGAAFNDRAPIQEMCFSFCIGTITKPLYKKSSSPDWQP